MKAPETYTFIVSRVYGAPVSWSISAWRFYLGIGFVSALLVGMLVMSLLFLATFPRLQQLEHQRDELRRQRDALQEQVLSANQEAFEARETMIIRVALRLAKGDSPVDEPAPSANRDEEYLPPVQITEVTTKVDRRNMEVVFRITEVIGSLENTGGFLFAVFENQDRNPPNFRASPKVGLNEDGFPETYKAGIRYPRVRRAVTYRRRIRLENPNDYFTHITIYLFSLRGGLLVKDRYTLDTVLFKKDGEGPRIQKLLSS